MKIPTKLYQLSEALASSIGGNRAGTLLTFTIFFILSSIFCNTRNINTLSIQASTITATQQHFEDISASSTTMPNTEADFVSNSTDDSDSDPSLNVRLCSRDEIRIGSWHPVTLKAPPYVPDTQQLRCYPNDAYKQKYWNTYDWLPSNPECSFVGWNPKNFCRLLFRATMLIIGDSLSWEHYRSLNHLLGNRNIHQNDQHQSKGSHTNVVRYVCPQRQTRLVYRRDDLLTNVSQTIFDEGMFPHVIVMNRGAHYKNDTTLLTGVSHVIQDVRAWQKECQIRNIKCHFFWRTSVPGHPRCNETVTSFTTPVNDLAKMEAMIANRSLYNNRTLQYHWFDYQHQNLLVEDLLRKELLLNNGVDMDNTLQILDGYYLNVLRPDEHRAFQGDCLHSCYPGKMDVYSRLLLHYLIQQRTKKDVLDLIDWQEQQLATKRLTVTGTADDTNTTEYSFRGIASYR
jgi:hypothetical protein